MRRPVRGPSPAVARSPGFSVRSSSWGGEIDVLLVRGDSEPVLEPVQYKFISDIALLGAVESLKYRLPEMSPAEIAAAIWDQLEEPASMVLWMPAGRAVNRSPGRYVPASDRPCPGRIEGGEAHRRKAG